MIKPKQLLRIAGITVLTAILAVGCKRPTDPIDGNDNPIVIPPTYSFKNVDYSGQQSRLNQLSEMTTYMKTGNDSGVVLDVEVLRAMFANTNENANGNFSFTTAKNLKDKCFEVDHDMFDQFFEDMADASESTSPASNGVAGVMVSEDGEKSYLFDANGRELTQYIEKGLMGAVFYYQATAVYMGTEKMDVDNEDVEEGKGTEMEHHWDEAYGYFGATTDFPDDIESVRFWAKYCVGRDAVLASVDSLGKALRKGRAAISAKNYTLRDEAISEAREAWELVSAGTAIHYLNGSIDNIGDDLVRNHELSEAWAFVNSLKYNPEKRITLAEIDEIQEKIGDNLYEATVADLQAARDQLAAIYGLDSVKSIL